MIKAECHSDDYLMQVNFDATPWFEQASDEEIQALMHIDWRGDYAADDVALYMQATVSKLKSLFEYVTAVHQVSEMGFEVSVDEESAMKWLKKNREHLVKE